MAKIDEYLNDIKEAVFGEEVRGSIHNAIDEINKEVVNYNAFVTEQADAAAESATVASGAAETAISAQSAAEAASDTATTKAAEAAEAAESAHSAKEQVKESVDIAAVQAATAKTEADRAKTEADKAASIVDIDVATLDKAGITKPDGETVMIDADGTLHAVGTTDYNEMENKPTINGFEMRGNAKPEDFGVYTDIQTFINGVFSGFLGNNVDFSEFMDIDSYLAEIRISYPNKTIILFVQKQDNIFFNSLPVENSCILTTHTGNMAGYAQIFDCQTQEIYIKNWYNNEGFLEVGDWEKVHEASKAFNIFVGKNVAENCTGENAKQQNVIIGCDAGNGLGNEQNRNTYIGTLAGGNSAGSYNTAVGDCALSGKHKNETFSENTGTENVAIGSGSMTENTTGSYNVAVGRSSMCKNTTGGWNTAIGKNTLYNNNGNNNIAIGADALNQNLEGTRNVAIGNSVLYRNTTGNYNVGIGIDALNENTAWSNTAVGDSALKKNTTGTNNVAVGRGVLNENTTGNDNVGIGRNALAGNLVSRSNVAVGAYSMLENTEGNCNTALGCDSLNKNTTGNNNIAVGYEALYENLAGTNNVAIGNHALKNNAGWYNVAIGHDSLKNNLDTRRNIAVGTASLYCNTEGWTNVALGADALNKNTTGNNNVALGDSALCDNETGSYNTAIGHDSLRNNNNYGWCTGLGRNSAVTGHNQVQLGSTDETTYCYGSIQNRSDERDKVDIRETDLGLDFIKALRPVKFRWNYREAYKEINEEGNTIHLKNDGSKARKRFHEGLIAQEVKRVMDDMGVEFAGYQDHSVNGGEDVLSIGYMELISPLIKAVQELSKEVENLKAYIAEK